jgi:hypothetical protein
VAWVESASDAFQCRHSSAHADEAALVLETLERARGALAHVFPRTVDGLTFVLHDSVASLALARPQAVLAWVVTAPAARRYVAGWAGRREVHLLSPAVLARRAANSPGSAQMLALAPATLYARALILECNHELHRGSATARAAFALRWAWLLEGGARFFSGETASARGAIVRRLREGGRPRFPPGLRDAPLLGGTVIDLLAREHGKLAAAQFATRLHPGGPRAALTKAFDGRPLVHTEGAWRSHLAALAAAA